METDAFFFFFLVAAMRLTTFLSSKLEGAELGALALRHSFGKNSPGKGNAQADPLWQVA